ncbi:MAG: RNA-guided endonuclease TnpB family protein [Cyanobacteria bacterium MAG APA_bin_95]|nr:RNA-guided endonuclease TnpB family protein [Cyanobacteria bacterium MAG APA_bin_95]
MLVHYRYRCYPEPGQKTILVKAFGCARVVWNDALALNRQLYERENKPFDAGELMKRCITQAKRSEERGWLAEPSHAMLQQSVRDLSQAFKNWFPKIGELKLKWSRPLPSPPTSVTIVKECSGRYYARFVVEVEEIKLPWTAREVGLDLGLESLAVTSGGEEIAPPKFLRSALRKIRRLQRSLSRKMKGSGNRQKARLLVARAQEKMAHQRLDLFHKLSTTYIRENQTVALEDLNVSGMLKNRRLAKNISDAGWRMFRTLLEYKASRYSREVKVISGWEPTSRRCSSCGHLDGKKSLSVRTWTCSACGAAHDRDINAAKSILAVGHMEKLNACGAESKSSLLVSGNEAGTRLDREALCPV